MRDKKEGQEIRYCKGGSLSSQEGSVQRVKGRILFPIPFPVASPEMEKREEREVPGIHEGRKALWEEGILLAKNGMPSIPNKMADSRNALLSGRPYTDPNALWDIGQTVA